MKFPDWIAKRVQIPPLVKWDVVLLSALFVFNVFNFSSWLHLGHVATSPWLLVPWLYGFVGLFPLAWRNKAPITVFAMQWLLAVAAWPFMSEYIPVVGIPVSLYAVSLHRGRSWASALTLVASFIPSGLDAYAASFRVTYPSVNVAFLVSIFNFVCLVAMAIGAWLLGDWIGVSQRQQQRLEREQEITRQAEVLGEERRKIAREMHDIVSHSVAVILLQAKAAAHVADTDFARITDSKFTQIKESLAHITTMGTQTMAELRRLLRVLETGDAAHELKPQPGLAQLTALISSLRAAGMTVTAHVEGTPQDLDPSVDLTAYRIVQEGLINVLKHAGKDANPCLRLVWKPQSLLIQIDNDANSVEELRTSALSVGRGLVGLRERARAVGGNLNAGSYKGSYRLIATLPFSTPEISLDSNISSQPREDQGKVPV
jgi:signal transduction histidine kinase